MKINKKILALILSATLAFSLIPLPAGIVYAQEQMFYTNEAKNIEQENTETNTEAKTEIETKIETESETETKIETETESEIKNETNTETVCETESEVQVNPTETEEESEIVVSIETESVQADYIEADADEETGLQVESIEDVLTEVYQFGGAPSEKDKLEIFESDIDYDRIKKYLYQQLLQHKTYVNVEEFDMEIEDLKAVVKGLLNDHSELYFVKYGVTYYKVGNKAVGIAFSYDESLDGVAFQKAKEMALAQIKPGMTDYEKAIVLHEYLVVNCEYDNENYNAGTIPAASYSAYGALVNRMAVCNGYALAYKYLLNQAGIDCYMVTSSAMNHAWNLIVLDGKYYHVDVTWDDPVWDVVGRAMHTYMFKSESAFEKHSKWVVTSGSEVVDYKAADTTYDNAFWEDSRAPLVLDGDTCYYISSEDRMIRKTTLDDVTKLDQKGTAICEVGVWKVRDKADSIWVGAYSGLFYVNNLLYYNDAQSIYSIGTNGKNKTKVFTANTEDGEIYGSGLCKGEVLYTIHEQPILSEKETVLKANIDLNLNDPTIIIVESISLDCDYLELKEDETYDFTVAIKPENTTDSNVIWTSSDKNIATVENGIVTAKSIGSCVIMASLGDKYAKCDVVVGESGKTEVVISGIEIKNKIYDGEAVFVENAITITTADGEPISDNIELEYQYTGIQSDSSVYESEKAPVNAGEYKVIVKVSNHNMKYKGSAEFSFVIEKATVNIKAKDITINVPGPEALPQDYEYEITGLVKEEKLVKEPEFTFKNSEGKDILPEYIDLYKEGRYYIVPCNADAGSNYLISYENGELVLKKDVAVIRTVDVKGLQAQTYTGKAVKPKVEIYSNYEDKLLKSGKDYTIKYFNNVNADSPEEMDLGGASKTGEEGDNGFTKELAYVVITGKGNYTGTIYKNFHINQVSVSDVDEDGNDILNKAFVLKLNEQLTVNSQKEQVVFKSLKYNKSLKAGSDYELSLTALKGYDENNKSLAKGVSIDKGSSNPKIPKGYSGMFLLTITGKGNYTGTITRDIYVADKTKLIKNSTIKLGKNQKNIKIVSVDELKNGITLEAGYYDEDLGKYYNSAGKEVQVDDIFTVKQNGKMLVCGQDYKVKYLNNKASGTATMIIEGINGYVGTKQVKFNITGLSFDAESIITGNNFYPEMTYTGNAVTQNNISLYYKNGDKKKALNYGKDYNITYKNNVKKGTATMTITANSKSGYTGSLKKTFKIIQADFTGKVKIEGMDSIKESNNIKLKYPLEYSKQGAKFPQGVKLVNTETGLKLTEGSDYKVSYYNNKTVTVGKNVSYDNKPYAIITGKGNYSGSIKIYFDIQKKAISLEDIKLASLPFSKKSEYEYKPAITIKDDAKKLKSGKDYIITYENNTQDNVVKYMNNDADAKHPTVTLIFPEESSYCFKDKEGKVLEKTVMPLRIYKNVLKKSELYVIVDDYTYSGKQIKPDGNSVRVYLGSAQNVKYVIENNVIDDASLREYGFIRFEQNKDYIIEDYGNNIFAGINSGKLKITGISKEYGGSVTVKFKILSKGIYKGKLN